jgi:hypothetical protein
MYVKNIIKSIKIVKNGGREKGEHGGVAAIKVHYRQV